MSKISISYLKPSHKLVEAVVERLLREVETLPSGAQSLSHLLVVVPTAQAGRQLRLSLAKHSGGAVMSPDVKTPPALLTNSRIPRPIATAPLAMSVLLDVLKSHGNRLQEDFPYLFPREISHPDGEFYAETAFSLLDLWNELGENLLLMSDVVEKADGCLALPQTEIDRWRDLAKLEKEYLAALHRLGYCHDTEGKRDAVKCPILPPGVRKIVIANVLDPLPAMYRFVENTQVPVDVYLHVDEAEADKYFDFLDGEDWPKLKLNDGQIPPLDISSRQIVQAPNAIAEAALVAEYFGEIRRANPQYELPALNLADESMFTSLQGAFLSNDFIVHNPAAEQMRCSALGRMVSQMAAMLSAPSPDFNTASLFLRSSDVKRWMETKINREEQGSFEQNLKHFDSIQQNRLPRLLTDVQGSVIAGILCDAVRHYGKMGFNGIRAWLTDIYSCHRMDSGKPGDREFAAAAQKLNELLNELSVEAVNPENRLLLMKKLVSRLTYSLEPDTRNTLMTTGWLEVAWAPEREIVLVGTVEGAVPESIVGHQYLPNSLREILGLPCNKSRFVRDGFILREILACRAPSEARIYCHARDVDGSPKKPSRLLLQCGADADLTALVSRLYAVPTDKNVSLAYSLPENWKVAPPMGKSIFNGGDDWMENFTVKDGQPVISVSQINEYLRSPFEFYKKKYFGSDRKFPEIEINYFDYGTIVHEVMQKFALANPTCRFGEGIEGDVAKLTERELKDADAVNRFFQKALDEAFEKRFGRQLSGIVYLQKAAMSKALEKLAPQQKDRYKEGWRIVAAEVSLSTMVNGVRIEGRADRVDCKISAGNRPEFQIVDYKTWNKEDKKSHSWGVKSKGKFAPLALHENCGIATFEQEVEEKMVAYGWRSLQLPLYCQMLDEAMAVGASLNLLVKDLPLVSYEVSSIYCILGTSDVKYCTDKEMRFTAKTYLLGKAMEAAADVIERIKQGVFWPPVERSGNKAMQDPYEYWKCGGSWRDVLSKDWLLEQKSRREKAGLLPAIEDDGICAEGEED